MKKIGILCAGEEELAPFLELIPFLETREKAMVKFHLGRFCGMELVAAYSGVCKVNAAIAAQVMIDTFQVTHLLNGGTAGAMDEQVKLFDTIISEQALYHDVAEDILTEFHPWLKENVFPAGKELLAAAKAYSLTVPEEPIRFGKMATGEQFITMEKREEINQRYAPLSVDMETASMAHVCYANRVPFLSVRTITDTPEATGIETFEKNCRAASEISAKILLGILEQLAK